MQSDNGNSSSGLLEKVIESWLTSINERQYQLPFCQLLAAEGEQVIYVSSHNPYEKGKDVVTITSDGDIRAYQLKAGDLNLSQWREIAGEVDDLVRLPVTHPSIPQQKWHTPYLVTNGEISEPVLEAIRAANDGWQLRNLPRLIVVTKGALLKRFYDVHGAYVPKEIRDLNRLLELFLKRGDDPLDKGQLATLLQDILPFEKEGIRPSALKQSVASATLMVSYVLQPYQRKENHWAIFEAWAVLAATIIGCAVKFGISRKSYESSLEICRLGMNAALTDLLVECRSRVQLIEGDALTDGHFYRFRVAVISGLLAALVLSSRLSSERTDEDFVLRFLVKQIREARLWGEGAVPYYMMAALCFEQLSGRPDGENLIGSVLSSIAGANSGDGTGLPNPYFSLEETIRKMHSLPPLNIEEFVGFSYSIWTLVEYLARRWRKQLLKRLWYSITRLSLMETQPAHRWGWLMWRTNEGVLDTKLVPEPQSWALLVQSAESRDTSCLPEELRENGWFLPYFLLVFPHRHCPATQYELEKLLKNLR